MVLNENEDISHFALIMLGIIVLIILYAYIGNLLQHKHIHAIHETGVGILLGIVFSVIVWAIKDYSDYQFNEQIFFYGLLPPMIFAGGYNLKKKEFFQNFLYIGLYGLFGTLVAFGIIFGLTYLINYLGWIINLRDGATITLSLGLIIKYSATICSTDAVAALTIIKPSKYPKLFSIVFGQGLTNDAIAIILFKVLAEVFDNISNQKTVATILFEMLWKFVLNIISSLGIGLVCAFLCCKLFQKSRFLSTNPVAQVTVIYMFGILSYVIAQVAHMSGVITVLVCGIVLAHFNFYNLSTSGQISTGVTFQIISFVAQAFVFIYMGISTTNYVKNYEFSHTFIFLQLGICIFARFVGTFALSYFVKLFKKQNWKVSFYELVIISFAGIIRGSVAYALILTIDGRNQEIEIVQSTVLVMVLVTTILLGGLMPTIISACLKRDVNNEQVDDFTDSLMEEHAIKEEKPLKGFKKFDQMILKPFFIYEYESRKDQIKDFKRLLKLNSSQYKGGEFNGILQANTRQTIVESNKNPQLSQRFKQNSKYSN